MNTDVRPLMNVSLDELNARCRGTLVSHLDIEFVAIGSDFLTATLPVDKRTIQPAGLLHGGATVALAETVASVAGNLIVHADGFVCVGLAINANHLRPVMSGRVTGTARPIHTGRSTQVHTVDVTDDDGQLVSVSRVTLAVVAKTG